VQISVACCCCNKKQEAKEEKEEEVLPSRQNHRTQRTQIAEEQR
jgi:hypothetical protein